MATRALKLGHQGLVLAAALGCLAFGRAEADTSYWGLATDRVTVMSNASAKRCQRIAAELLSFERVLRELAALDEDSQFAPMTIYSLSADDFSSALFSEADRRQGELRRVQTFSKFFGGPGGNMAAITEFNGIDEPLQSVFLLYGETVLRGWARTYPIWYQTGVSELTNGILIREDGSALLSRDGSFEPEVDKSAPVKYDLATLLTASGRDLSSSGDLKAFTRRAHEFAQYGLLTLPERRAHYRELAILMRQGVPAEQAVKQAFGVGLDELARDFEYGSWRNHVQLKIPAPSSMPVLPPAERLDASRVQQLLQQLATRAGQSRHP
jgi:hypothetical protein